MKISLKGEVTPDIVKSIKSRILQTRKQRKIFLTINSEGGDPTAALDMYRFLRKQAEDGRKIVGWVPKQANSAALIAYFGCPERACSPDATFLFHNVLVEVPVGLTRTTRWDHLVARMAKMYRRSRELQKAFDEVTINSTFLPRPTLVHLSNNGSQGDAPLSAVEAKCLGFVHTITRSCPS